MKLFPEKSHAASFAWSQHRNRGLDEATKAGIGGRLQHAFVGYSILGDAHAANQHRIAMALRDQGYDNKSGNHAETRNLALLTKEVHLPLRPPR